MVDLNNHPSLQPSMLACSPADTVVAAEGEVQQQQQAENKQKQQQQKGTGGGKQKKNPKQDTSSEEAIRQLRIGKVAFLLPLRIHTFYNEP